MVYVRDVANVRDGNPPQNNIVHVEGSRSVLMQVLKNGSVSTLAIIAGIKERSSSSRPSCRRISPSR
jgi:multidrug efflux pump subunit AcrB